MRILVAAASFSSEMSGVQRHAFNVVRCLLKHRNVSAVDLIVAPWQRNLARTAGADFDSRVSTHIAPMENTSVSRNLWYYRKLPAVAASLKVDVVHLSYPMPINSVRFTCPTVVTLHDLYPYEIPLNFGFPKFLFNRVILQQCLRSVDAIACVSDATREQLRKYVPTSVSNRSTRIYNCVETAPSSSAMSPIPGWSGQQFLLCVAQHRRNKNIPLLIHTFARLLATRDLDSDAQMVIVGIRGPETKRIEEMISALRLKGKVHLLEGLPEDALQWCYARCEAVVVPSSTEGFGLPVAEALLAGCRVVCSDIPALREVGGQHCRFIPLGDNAVARFAEGISAIIREPAPLPLALPQLSAEVLAEQYIGLYRQLSHHPNCGRSTPPVTALKSGASEQELL
jgi:glycosyltransferase involved in cell wall biosynthesis